MPGLLQSCSTPSALGASHSSANIGEWCLLNVVARNAIVAPPVPATYPLPLPPSNHSSYEAYVLGLCIISNRSTVSTWKPRLRESTFPATGETLPKVRGKPDYRELHGQYWDLQNNLKIRQENKWCCYRQLCRELLERRGLRDWMGLRRNLSKWRLRLVWILHTYCRSRKNCHTS